jgi:hypothetical protein
MFKHLQLKSKLTTLERDRPRDDSPAACVIAASILPPPSSHCALILARKIRCALKKISFYAF